MEKTLKIIILTGLPAAGKSTWAKNYLSKNQNTVRVNRDLFREMLQNAQICDDKIEKLINDLINYTILASLDRRLNVIIDNTNLKAAYINEFIELVKYKADVEFIIFDVSVDKCIERDLLREKKVGETIIKKMNTNFLILKDSFLFETRKKLKRVFESKKLLEQQMNKNNLSECIICDLDGTLFFMGDRSPYDYKKVDCDFINVVVRDHLNYHREKGRKIFLFSGRSVEAKNLTIETLDFYNVQYDTLCFRGELNNDPNDGRRDSIVKEEMYNFYIKDKYFPFVVYDDRSSVIDLWRKKLGLTTFQVNYGDF
jgi:predicted kinase